MAEKDKDVMEFEERLEKAQARHKEIYSLAKSTVESMTELGMNLREYDVFKRALDEYIQKVKISHD